jgi:hypothetical protein
MTIVYIAVATTVYVLLACLVGRRLGRLAHARRQ